MPKGTKGGRSGMDWTVISQNVALGVATIAITKARQNPFSEAYERLVSKGVSSANAKSTVARKALRVPWVMWK